MQAVQQSVNQRRAERKPVSWEANARMGDLLIRGTVRDFSVYGVFFEPEMATDGFDFYFGDEVMDQIEQRGDIKLVTNGLVLESKMRWLGHSDTHNCLGFGCEFEHVGTTYN